MSDNYEDHPVKINVNNLPEALRHLVKGHKSTHPQDQPTSTLNPDGISRACQCGARHTSNPSWHMNYCPMKEY